MGIKATGFSIDYASNTVELTKDFIKKAQDWQSNEYRILKRIKSDFPGIDIERRTVSRPKNSKARVKTKGLTYKVMRSYIKYLRDSKTYYAEMERLIDMSETPGQAFGKVRKWFLNAFPLYNELPIFDDEGFIILPEPKTDTDNNILPMPEPKAS